MSNTMSFWLIIKLTQIAGSYNDRTKSKVKNKCEYCLCAKSYLLVNVAQYSISDFLKKCNNSHSILNLESAACFSCT